MVGEGSQKGWHLSRDGNDWRKNSCSVFGENSFPMRENFQCRVPKMNLNTEEISSWSVFSHNHTVVFNTHEMSM